MEGAGAVQLHIGVGTEEVPLRLRQVGWEARAATPVQIKEKPSVLSTAQEQRLSVRHVLVQVRQRCGEGGQRDTMLNAQLKCI